MIELFTKEAERIYVKSPLLVIFRGIPGCGKTILNQEVQKRVMNATSIETIDPDLIDKNDSRYGIFITYLRESELDLEDRHYLYRYLLDKATKALKNGKVVFWDQPFTDLEGLAYTIRRIIKNVVNSGGPETKVLIVDIETPRDKALERIRRRKENGGHGPTTQTFLNFVGSFRTSEDLNYARISVSGDDDNMERSCTQILTTIDQINTSPISLFTQISGSQVPDGLLAKLTREF